MPDYLVFGGCFRSELSFPELPEFPESTSASADWTLRRVASPPPAHDLVLIGETRVEPEVVARQYRFEGGFRIVYDDTGTFDVSAGGAEILWFPGPDTDEDAARVDIIGYVFATVFHAAGTLCLHGSAVALGRGGIAFVAPKHHGKSTLARALTGAGARLVTDDAIPVEFGAVIRIRPGVHQLRLWNDSAAHFAGDGRSYRSGYGGKNVLTNLEPDRLMLDPVPLSAVYVLAPVKPKPGTAVVQRVQLAPVQATLSLVTHAKIGAILGKSEAAAVLDRAGDLARNVPVYRLDIVRDFKRLDEAAEKLLAWHGAAAAAPEEAA